MNERLFRLSIPEEGRYRRILKKSPDYCKLVTFEQNKNTPIYNWFYYKEGFSPNFVWNILRELNIEEGSLVMDPFCGVGNVLLACKQSNYNSIGIDISPLSVFISNTKLQENYDMGLLREKIDEIPSLKPVKVSLRWPKLGFIDVRKAFPRFARNDLLFFRERIMQIEDEKIRNLFMLALLSIVTPVSNITKDGGVLKIRAKRRVNPPVRDLLRNKLRRMYKDIKDNGCFKAVGSEAILGDARSLLINDAVDICITSPPYLNWVDYTKVYALELALLLGSGREIKRIRSESIRSHVGARDRKKRHVVSEKLDKVMEALNKKPSDRKPPATVRGYFEDMYMCMDSIYKALREEGIAVIVIGNACMPNITIDSDLILAELSEEIGFTPIEIKVAKVRWCDVHGIRKERPVRESIVILKK